MAAGAVLSTVGSRAICSELEKALRRRPRFLSSPSNDILTVLVQHAASAVTVLKLGVLPRSMLRQVLGLMRRGAAQQSSRAAEQCSDHFLEAYEKVDKLFKGLVDAIADGTALPDGLVQRIAAFQVRALHSNAHALALLTRDPHA